MSERAELPAELVQKLAELARGDGRLVVLSGAGISAESGIPTFRGKEGYWVVGSREYMPQDMATHSMFSREPEAIWCWYLYRRGVCRRAGPNEGHQAVVAMEELLGDRFLLLTQNVDGLHLQAGNSAARTFQIHGNIDYARCDVECGQPIWALPPAFGLGKQRGSELTDDERRKLRCPGCGAWARPHVLWFDECYDEEHFRFRSSLEAAVSASMLVVVGTSGATNLPMQVGHAALQTGATIVDINPEPNPFSRLAESAETGFYLQGSGGANLPLIVEALRAS